MSKVEKVVAVFTEVVTALKEDTERLAKELDIDLDNPVADCRVKVVDGDTVVFTYDGRGYNLFSMDAFMENPFNGKVFSTSAKNREVIRKAVAAIDPNLVVEDNNSWSMSVVVD